MIHQAADNGLGCTEKERERKRKKTTSQHNFRYQMRSRQIGLAHDPSSHPSLTSSERHQKSQDLLSRTSSVRHSIHTPHLPAILAPRPLAVGAVSRTNHKGKSSWHYRTLARCLEVRKRKARRQLRCCSTSARQATTPPRANCTGNMSPTIVTGEQDMVHECDAVSRPTLCARIVDGEGLMQRANRLVRQRPRQR
ncbi:hypothetical protein LZ30DRAFT_336778 [Colletotrichum cereale]|nr:hypothetical protein LZ30DRAFT_336778 [Colletotrichum cereale]